jgi:uncharacterized protein (DUF488 family)
MDTTIYTLGYTGANADEIQQLVEQHDWWMVDIRMSATSRQPKWTKKALVERFGERYVHLPAFGNKNYKSGGAIVLADPDAGLRATTALMVSKPVVLMCACRNVDTCHRKTAAEFISTMTGVSVRHLSLGDIKALLTPPQPEQVVIRDTVIQSGMPGFAGDKVTWLVPETQQPRLF